MNYFLHGFGVFLGVLAGTAVTILVTLCFDRRAKTQQTQNLKFELELNVAKIDTWLAELERYRDAVNGDSLHQWFGYFDLGKVVSVTANAMLASGLLYKKLDKDDIAALQELVCELSLPGEQCMNNDLGQNRQILENYRAQNRINDWIQHTTPQSFLGHSADLQ